MNQTPLIIGHRGAAAVAPENTLVSFERAIADGADGIEFDIRLSKDGVPVCIHDTDLRRTGLREGVIASLSSSELTEICVGEWFNRKFPASARPEYASTKIPSLAQVFNLFRDCEHLLYVELKCESKDEAGKLAAATVKLIHEHHLAEQVVVESFLLDAIKEIKLLDPGLRTAALFDRKVTRPFIMNSTLIARSLDCGADQIAIHYTLAGPRLVRLAKDQGLSTVVWTVDRPAWVARARERGIRALITNSPRLLVSARK